MRTYLYLIILVSSFALAKQAMGAVPPDGYYRSVNAKPQFEAFIKSVTIDNVPTTYAALFESGYNIKNSEDYEYGALFRLEELEDGSMVWALIYQAKNNLLSMKVDSPYYQSTLTGTSLRLWATEAGKKSMCASSIELSQVPGPVWASTSGQVKLTDRFNRTAYLDTTSLQIESSLNDLWAKDSKKKETKDEGKLTSYYLTPSLAMAQVLRWRAFDSESASGLSFSREIRGISVSTYSQNKWTAHILNSPVGNTSCWFQSTRLN